MILQVKGLNKSFRHPWSLKPIPVLHDVSFSIEKKSIVGFLGGNGTGKTTSIKCLLGLLKYESGQVLFFNGQPLGPGVKSQIGYLPERPFFYSYLTAEEFLKFYGQLSGMKDKRTLNKRIGHLLELLGLGHARKMYLRQFSKGMLQRVGLAQALIHRPQLLVLDEPLSGLDPDGRRQMAKVIQDAFNEEGASLFFSSHLLDDVDRLCQDLVLINGGRIQYSGSKESFVNRGRRGYIIRSQSDQGVLQTSAENLESLQKSIDQLRSKSHDILSVEPEKMSLDQAFKDFQELSGEV